jgi:endoglucanase
MWIQGFILLAVLLTQASGLAAAPAELKTSGNQIVTVVGNCPVRLKGVNIPSLEWDNDGDGPPPTNQPLATVQQMVTNWGCNVIRLPLNQDRWFGYCGVAQNTYRGYIDGIVNYCNTAGVYVMLDLHWNDTGTWNSGNVCSGGQHNMPDNNSALFWTDVATRYANNPAVLFDLYNEPHDDTWSIWKNGGTSSEGFATPGHQSLLNTVRATGAKNLAIVGGLDWAYDLRQIPSFALADSSGNGVAYATHIYPWKPTPWGTYIPAAVIAAYPVLVTEFGQDNGNPDTTGAWTQSVINWANTNNLGYIAWCMHTGATPSLITDWAFTPSAWFGVKVKAALLATSGGGCSGTATVTPSRTPSITPSPSVTPSRTPSPSITPSRTPNSSSTPSPANSPSATPTGSFTRTVTATATPSATRSATPSVTPSFSPSRTPSASASVTASVTASPVFTATASVTASPAFSATATATASPAFSATATTTASPTFSATATRTVSPVFTATATVTASPVFTATATVTASPVFTATATPTVTSSFTAGSTATATRTATPTATVSRSSTVTLTATPTDTPPVASTATSTGTITPAVTDSPVQGSGGQVTDTLPSANPQSLAGGVLLISGKVDAPCDGFELKIFTKAETAIQRRSLQGAYGTGWHQLAFGGLDFPNGIYYYQLKALGGGKPRLGKVLILK